MRGEWDPDTARKDLAKHGASFEDASLMPSRVDDDCIRIVSARKATRQEQERFDAFWRGRHG